MASIQLSNKDDYSLYESWANKLTDVYTAEANKLTDLYTELALLTRKFLHHNNHCHLLNHLQQLNNLKALKLNNPYMTKYEAAKELDK